MLVLSPIALAATIIVGGFSLIFLILVFKWMVKRTREISERFESEIKEIDDNRRKLYETRGKINLLEKKYREFIDKNDMKNAEIVNREIKKLKIERDKLFKKMQDL